MLGVELGHNHMISMEMAAADTELRQFTISDGFANSVTVTGQSSLEPIDYAVTASVDASGTPPSGSGLTAYRITPSGSESRNNVFIPGVDLGLGLNVRGAAQRVRAR